LRSDLAKFGGVTEPSLPRHDLILLPLVSLLTVILMLGGGEALARLAFPKHTSIACVSKTQDAGERFQPNCVALTKAAEGPWVENRFNECGYRTAEPCAAKQPGQLRVVVLGSSTARGALVPYAETFAARASAALRARCHRMVDFQNLATDSRDLRYVPKRVAEALSLAPDAVMMLIGPYDIEHFAAGLATGPTLTPLRIATYLRELRLFEVAQYALYRDPAVQIHAFLRNGAASSGYAIDPLPAFWQSRLAQIGTLLDGIAKPLGAAGTPFILIYVPERALAAMARPEYAGLTAGLHANPRALPAALGKIAARSGAIYADATPSFASAIDFNDLYYRTDGHPSAGGHGLIAGQASAALLGLPAFAGCRGPARQAAR
jgi:hypothetical protein